MESDKRLPEEQIPAAELEHAAPRIRAHPEYFSPAQVRGAFAGLGVAVLPDSFGSGFDLLQGRLTRQVHDRSGVQRLHRYVL